eukprot:m.90097 g.90097  ORF g.90097 m.90097 type:complete len:298 (-) comp15246_c0_seq8:579-1472(-)
MRTSVLCLALAVAAVAVALLPGNTEAQCPPPACTPSQLNIAQFMGKRVLFVFAHADDVETMAGGLISLLTAQGTTVGYVVMTNGDKGGLCYNSSGSFACGKEEIAEVRKQEQLAAAAYLGVPQYNVRFYDLEDGLLNSYDEYTLRIKLTATIRSFQPYAVFTWFTQPDWNCPPRPDSFPFNYGDLGYHPDHQRSGQAVLDTLKSFFPELPLAADELGMAGIAPWRVSQFYMFALSSPHITHYVPLDEGTLQRKINALSMQKSQISNATATALNVRWLAQQTGQAIQRNQPIEGFTAY